MTLKRKRDCLFQYQLSRSLHDKVRPYIDFYLSQGKSGKLSYEEAVMYADSAVQFTYLFKDVTAADLIAWSFTGWQSPRPRNEPSE